MRLLLLAICLFVSATLIAQNYPAPLLESEYQDHPNSDDLLNDPFLISDQIKEHKPNQRIAYVGQSTINEQDRLIYDSLIWEVYDEDKDTWNFSSINKYTRDENGNPILILYQLFDTETSAWQNETKYERTYTEDSLETSYIKSTWDDDTESYVGVEKIIQEFNDNKIRTFFERYAWNEEYADWEGEYKYESAYNESGLATSYSDYLTWDWDSKEWVGNYKNDYSYNENNDQIERIGYDWDSEIDDWEKSSKTVSAYNESNALSTSTSYNWDDTDIGDWVLSFKHDYTYNEDGTIKNVLSYDSDLSLYWKREHTYGDEPDEVRTNYSISDGQSYKENKDEYNYNELGQETGHKYYFWDSSGDGFWELNSYSEFNFDGEGRRIFSKNAYWNDALGKAQNSSKYIWEYDEFGYYTAYERYAWSEENQSWYGTSATHYVRSGEYNYLLDEKNYDDWDFETNSWIGENRYTYEVNDHAKRKFSNYYNWIDGGWKHTYRATYYHHLDCSSSSTPVHNYLTLEDQTELCSVESLVAPTAVGCGGDLTATTDAEFPIEAVGTNEVTWTYDDGNGNTSTQIQKVIIDQSCQPLSVDLNKLVEVYPNPTLGIIQFKQKMDEVKVYGQNGQLEIHLKSPGASMDISKLKAGIYYLNLSFESNTAKVKILKN